MLRSVLGLSGFLLLTACDQWHLSINSDGLVFISVIGSGEPRDRFRVRFQDARGMIRIVEVPPSGQLSLTPVADGALQLTLLTPEDCQVAGPNPRGVAAAAGQEVRVAFDVRCS